MVIPNTFYRVDSLDHNLLFMALYNFIYKTDATRTFEERSKTAQDSQWSNLSYIDEFDAAEFLAFEKSDYISHAIMAAFIDPPNYTPNAPKPLKLCGARLQSSGRYLSIDSIAGALNISQRSVCDIIHSMQLNFHPTAVLN